MASRFKTTDLGLMAYYLRMEVFQDKETIIVMQIVYIDQLLKTYQMSNYNVVSIPIVERLHLAPVLDDFIPNTNNVLAYK